MTSNKSSTEKALRMIRDLTRKVKSDERDIDPEVLHLQWHSLHSLAIFALIHAEQFKCPTRIQLIMDISHELDDDALPVGFYKRLVRAHIEIKKSGNRRTRNQTRNAIMKLFLRRLGEVSGLEREKMLVMLYGAYLLHRPRAKAEATIR